MIILGIDPGLSGALAMLENGVMLGVYDLPVSRDNKRSWIDGSELRSIVLTRGGLRRAYIEAVHAMPKQGVTSSFSFGMGFGSIVGCLQAILTPIEFVPPTQWKKDLNLSRDKDSSLNKARLLFPGADLRLKKHEGRAEALLIAHWAYTKYFRKESP
jgi:crossover junction endodeoxyribonuclease RuvC